LKIGRTQRAIMESRCQIEFNPLESNIIPLIVLQPAINLAISFFRHSSIRESFKKFALSDVNYSTYEKEVSNGCYTMNLITRKKELDAYACTYMDDLKNFFFNPLLVLSMVRRLNELSAKTSLSFSNSTESSIVVTKKQKLTGKINI
jgi:hypothetical protein